VYYKGIFITEYALFQFPGLEHLEVYFMKLVWLSDNWDGFSGVGLQSRHVLTGLRDKGHEVVNIAGFMGPRHGIQESASQGIRKYNVVNASGTGGIVGIHQLRHILRKELPDVFVAFHDPRLVLNTFFADNEIKESGPFVFWHLWDSAPYPEFNDPFYESVDSLVCISKFTYDLLKERHGDKTIYIPHGIDPEEFYPLPEKRRQEELNKFNRSQRPPNNPAKFIIFWNQRNMPRKRVGSLVEAYGEFSKTRPGTALLMHTSSGDPSGMNLSALIAKYVDKSGHVVVSEAVGQPSEYLNTLLAMSDVSINITNNEGFGLSTVEALFAGIPIIATDTGGLITQLHSDEEREISGIALQPDATNVSGDQQAALYVTQDFVSIEQIVKALQKMYDMTHKERRAWGEKGRQHAMKNFHVKDVVNSWEEHLLKVIEEWQPIPNFRVTTL